MAEKSKRSFVPAFNGLLIVALALAALHFQHESRVLRAHVSQLVKVRVGVEDVAAVFPGAARIEYCDAPGEACRVFDSAGALLGSILCSSPSCDDIKGYAGPVPVIIALDSLHTITAVVPLANNETGAFIARLRKEGFFGHWTGVGVRDVAAKKVDAVSGATISSTAIIETVRKRAALFAKSELKGAAARGYLARQIVAVFFMLPGFAAAFMPKFGRIFRVHILTSNVIILGFITATLLSLAFVHGSAVRGLNMAGQWHLLVLAAAAVASGICTGKNAYCGFVCPYGSAQELAAKLMPKRHRRLPHALGHLYRHGRAIVLLLIFGAALALPQFDAGTVEPFSAFAFRAAPLSAIALAGIFIAASIVYPRLWCRAFCPTGKLLDILRGRHGKMDRQ